MIKRVAYSNFPKFLSSHLVLNSQEALDQVINCCYSHWLVLFLVDLSVAFDLGDYCLLFSFSLHPPYLLSLSSSLSLSFFEQTGLNI